MNQADAFRETVRIAEQRGMPEMPGSDLGLHHLRSILATVNRSKFPDGKLGRWLGWAQCALVAANVGVDSRRYESTEFAALGPKTGNSALPDL